jgi:hypothetical protein
MLKGCHWKELSRNKAGSFDTIGTCEAAMAGTDVPRAERRPEGAHRLSQFPKIGHRGAVQGAYEWTVSANIASDDALILPHHAVLSRKNIARFRQLFSVLFKAA